MNGSEDRDRSLRMRAGETRCGEREKERGYAVICLLIDYVKIMLEFGLALNQIKPMAWHPKYKAFQCSAACTLASGCFVPKIKQNSFRGAALFRIPFFGIKMKTVYNTICEQQHRSESSGNRGNATK